MFYVLALGTNMGDRTENLKAAVVALGRLPHTAVVSASAVYETAPVGYAQQPPFYNCCLLVSSLFSPGEMLGACLGIEAGFGRVRKMENGPRVLDIDLILAQDKKINTENLTVPHPRFLERRFVLQPLKDIFTDERAFGIDFSQALNAAAEQDVQKVNGLILM